MINQSDTGNNASAESTRAVRYTYDKEADASYFYLRDIASGEVADTYTCEGLPAGVKGEVNLDFDKDGNLLGIEILNASRVLGGSYTSNT